VTKAKTAKAKKADETPDVAELAKTQAVFRADTAGKGGYVVPGVYPDNDDTQTVEDDDGDAA
jgi:hypothetical protein